MRRRRGLVLAALGAVGFSGKAIIVKLAYRHGVDAVTLIMYRMLFALPMFLLLSWWAGRGKPALTWRDARTVLALGFCGYYLSSFLDFVGLRYISASLERLILYLNPTLVLALGAFLFHKKVTRAQILALAVSYCGVLCVFGRELSVQGANVPLGATLVFAQRGELRRVSVVQRRGSEAPWRAAAHGFGNHGGLPHLHRAILAAEAGRRPCGCPRLSLWLSVLNATLCTFAPVLHGHDGHRAHRRVADGAGRHHRPPLDHSDGGHPAR